MIDSKSLLSGLQREVTALENDLRARCEAEPSVDAPLKARYDEARARQRTALTYNAWREEELTNIAVAWVLACVFVRFLEDNGLVDTLYLAGPDAAGLARARDQHEVFFREHPHFTEREYLEHVFTTTATLPAMAEFFDRRHNPLWSAGPSGDAAAALVNFWRRADPESGRPLHDFSDPEWATRFLGDIYQDLSAAARKRYALLQTPVFVEQFILDRTLTPAIQSFGFRVVRMIDPTCGSGHFLLGGFARLHRLWLEAEPGESPAVLAQRALDQVFGVDLNPNVVAIARFRLLLAALRATGTTRLRHAFDFKIHVVTGDSLLHGRRFREFESDTGAQRTFDTEEAFRDELKHHYEVEDADALHRILGQQYHTVVGNPPYITVKDRAISELYRARFPSCSGKYALSVPFMERFFDLAVKGDGTPQQPGGFVGQITGNNFMKREFGKKLIEEYLPRWDLTHVLDTAGAYIPGHGTPTVILFGKNQPPVSATIRTVLGIRGEPATPADPAYGVVWQAICRQIDQPGSTSEWVSAGDSPRVNFHKHPWSIGGGGASELKEQIEDSCDDLLGKFTAELGITSVTGEDDLYLFPRREDLLRLRVEMTRPLVTGDLVREWRLYDLPEAIWLYDEGFNLFDLKALPNTAKLLWNYRPSISRRKRFGTPMLQRGLTWYEWQELYPAKLRTPLTITFAFVATHNHFVLDRGGMVFKQSAPVIKLKPDATEADHLRLMGVLNSSTACFWLKQVAHNKGDSTDQHGARTTGDIAFNTYEFTATQLVSFPLPSHQPTHLPTALVQISTALHGQSPAATLASWGGPESDPLATRLANARAEAARLRGQLIAQQEELDWQIYAAFGLIAAEDNLLWPEDRLDELPPLQLGERTFEILMARQMARGTLQTTWFERHAASGSRPITEPPAHWPADYIALYHRRHLAIQENPNLKLIEQPEYKRRWNTEPWDEQFTIAARDWLLARLEGYFHEGQRVCELKDGFSPAAAGFVPATRPAFTTSNQLAGMAQTDAAFLAVAEALQGGPGFSMPKLVRELVEGAAVPFLPVQRYKPSGLLKRRDWEHIWDLQRREDAIDAAEKVDEAGLRVDESTRRKQTAAARKKTELGDIPVPPKYGSGDFKKSVWWSLRGKLDVPKERWVSYPGVERTEDPSPVIAWAGWDHAQQARALAEYYVDGKENYGFPPEKLKLLLAGLLELEPWLFQWHSALDPLVGDSPANAIRGFLDAECHALGLTRADLEKVRMGA